MARSALGVIRLLFNSLVTEAVRESGALNELVQLDLDPVGGGIAWWGEFNLATDTRISLSDYTFSVSAAVRENLLDAAASLNVYMDRKKAEDYWLHLRMSAGADKPDFLTRSPSEQLREATMDSELGSFFRSAGSVLDTLAACTIAVAGLSLDVVRADLGVLNIVGADPSSYPRTSGGDNRKLARSLMPADSEGGQEQDEILRILRTTLERSGPNGWLNWTMSTRNSIVHRARSVGFVFPAKPKGRNVDHSVARPLARDPSRPEVCSWRESDKLKDFVLAEDASVTITGILGSINAAVTAISLQLQALWLRRQARPDLISQPAQQWPELQAATTRFDGYRPQPSLIPVSKDIFALVHPALADRLRSARVTD